MRVVLLFFLPILLPGQITVSPTAIVAQAASQTCVITPTGGTCVCTRGDGLVFTCVAWAPNLNNGADESFSNTHNGNLVSVSLSMRTDGSIWWYVFVRPNGGTATQQGFTKFPPPGPVTVGTLVNGVCLAFGTGFHEGPIVASTVNWCATANGICSPATISGASWVSNEVQANCLLP